MNAILLFFLITWQFKFNFTLQQQNNQKTSNALDKVNFMQILSQKTNLTTIGIQPTKNDSDNVSCTCAVFLSGQFQRGSTEQPKGLPALMHEQEVNYPCTLSGNKQCINKCLDSIVKHLPNSAAILCGSIDRDCYKERAYLFFQNCSPLWINTNLSAGKEYCCKDGLSFKCPII